jgi:hypothetical protein
VLTLLQTGKRDLVPRGLQLLPVFRGKHSPIDVLQLVRAALELLEGLNVIAKCGLSSPRLAESERSGRDVFRDGCLLGCAGCRQQENEKKE